jgi:hypothetical protein
VPVDGLLLKDCSTGLEIRAVIQIAPVSRSFNVSLSVGNDPGLNPSQQRLDPEYRWRSAAAQAPCDEPSVVDTGGMVVAQIRADR